jgi:hypothetical protein
MAPIPCQRGTEGVGFILRLIGTIAPEASLHNAVHPGHLSRIGFSRNKTLPRNADYAEYPTWRSIAAFPRSAHRMSFAVNSFSNAIGAGFCI